VRILLVEDHEETGRVLARLLKNRGHHVEHARDLASAVRLVEAGAFDLVVSDIGLPDGSGLELMKQIRTSRPTLNAICLSGYGMQDDVQASLEAGFREHLTKPIDVQQLHAAIARCSRLAPLADVEHVTHRGHSARVTPSSNTTDV
jgi:CheY-like chemotaxis protein